MHETAELKIKNPQVHFTGVYIMGIESFKLWSEVRSEEMDISQNGPGNSLTSLVPLIHKHDQE